jgi:peptide/nickel transport system permease protein
MSEKLSPKQRFLKNRTAIVGLICIVFFVGISMLGYLILPDPTTHANHQVAEFSRLAPGSQVFYIKKKQANQQSLLWIFSGKTNESWIPMDNETLEYKSDTIFYYRKNGKREWILSPYLQLAIDEQSAFSRQQLKESGKLYQLSDGEVIFQSKNGIERRKLQDLNQSIQVQKFRYILGSDIYGRDILSRLLLGTRSSLSIGFLSMLFSLLIGVIAGIWAGWSKAWAENIFIWFMTIIWSVPTLLLAIAVAFVLGKGYFSVILAIGLTSWVDIARMVKTEVQKIKNQLFIEAAFSLGFNDFKILVKHILPNMIPVLLILSCANFASAVLLEAGLSFLGLGIPAPIPTWGAMIFDGYSYIVMENGKWLAIFPGLAIISLVLSLNWLANGLRDAWDIK